MTETPIREIPIVPPQSALLFIDVQNFNARPDGGEYKDQGLKPEEAEVKHAYFFKCLKEVVIPNMQRLQHACRAKGIEFEQTDFDNVNELDWRV